MDTRIMVLLGIALALCLAAAGCSDSSEPAPASDTPAVAATTTGPLFTAGDIVRSASGTESPAWLVLSYDPASDSYERALIYKKADGTYGYRTGTAAETSKRSVMERIYTLKITHVDVSAVVIGAPTTVTTAAATTIQTTTTRTTTSPAATLSSLRPSIKSMDPDEGEAGTGVTTEITGKDFEKNITAVLRKSGEGSIKARNVNWFSATSVTLTFDLPNTTKVGPWDIVLTNPNGLSGEITNYFIVRGNGTAD